MLYPTMLKFDRIVHCGPRNESVRRPSSCNHYHQVYFRQKSI